MGPYLIHRILRRGQHHLYCHLCVEKKKTGNLTSSHPEGAWAYFRVAAVAVAAACALPVPIYSFSYFILSHYRDLSSLFLSFSFAFPLLSFGYHLIQNSAGGCSRRAVARSRLRYWRAIRIAVVRTVRSRRGWCRHCDCGEWWVLGGGELRFEGVICQGRDAGNDI